MTTPAKLTVNVSGPCESVRVVGFAPAPGRQAGAGGAAGRDVGQLRQQMQAMIEEEQARMASARTALVAAVGQLVEAREKVLQNADEQLLQLAMKIARKVLMQEIQAGRYEIEPIVKEALGHVSTQRDVTVRLNPDDYAKCEMASQQAASEETSGLRFVADPAIPPAQCVVETPEGVVESSAEAHLEDIGRALEAI